MIQSLPLWSGRPPHQNPNDDFLPMLDLYPVETGVPAGAIMICPGGGYSMRAEHEGKDIAEFFNRCGLHAFVLQYRVKPHRHPAPLLDAARGIRIIRSHAKEWTVDPDHIAVCGFSAGGHLTGTLGTLFHHDLVSHDMDDSSVSCRPDALLLCYAVLSGVYHVHQGSYINLLGNAPPDELVQLLSPEQQVTPETPPSFLWHTADDQSVKVGNSLHFAQALEACQVPFEMHIYPHGPHGLGLAGDLPDVSAWSPLAAAWLARLGWPGIHVD